MYIISGHTRPIDRVLGHELRYVALFPQRDVPCVLHIVKCSPYDYEGTRKLFSHYIVRVQFARKQSHYTCLGKL